MIEIIAAAKISKLLAHDIEYDPYKEDGSEVNYWDEDFKIHGCSFATFEGQEIISVYLTDFEDIAKVIDATFSDDSIEKWAHFAKSEYNCLKKSGFGIPSHYNLRDTSIALNLINEDRDKYGLKIITPEFLGYELEDFAVASANGLDTQQFYNYAIGDSIATLKLAVIFMRKIKELDLDYTFDLISPSIIVFGDMEMSGIHWDVDIGLDLQEKFERLKASLENEIYSEIGRINLNSPAQIANRLFKERKFSTSGLDVTPKGAISTGEANMEKLAIKYPVCELIGAYRTCEKMVSTYLLPFTTHSCFNDDERLHGRFELNLKTGRTKCKGLGLQTTSKGTLGDKIRHEVNKAVKAYLNDIKIRSGFTPPKGRALVCCDLSSVEYRCAAVAAPDAKLIKMYCDWDCSNCGASGSTSKVVRNCLECGKPAKQGKDLHQANADIANKFGLSKTRQDAKELSFLSIFYGTAWKLSKSWNCDYKIAEKVLSLVFDEFKGLKKWHERTEAILRAPNQKDGLGRVMEQGEVRDIFNRRRKVDLQATRKKVHLKAKEEGWDQKTLERKLKGAEKNLANMLINFVAQSPTCIIGQLAMQEFRTRMIKKGMVDD